MPDKTGMQAHGIMFHHFCDATHPAGQGAMSADDLLALIAHVGRHNILPAHEWYWRATNNLLQPNHLCLTFDDALRCQYDVALPILQANGLTAFFFVYTSVIEGNLEPLEIYRHFRTTRFDSIDAFYNAFFASVTASDSDGSIHAALQRFVPGTYLPDFPFYSDNDRRFRYLRDELLGPQRYHAAMKQMMQDAGHDVRQAAERLWMTPAMLRDLHADGHVIGLHSHTHPTRLNRFNPADQWRQYKTNFDVLAGLLGQAPRTMSHPCNSYNADTLAVLRRLDIRLGFRANMARGATSELEFPREDHANLLARMTRTRAA